MSFLDMVRICVGIPVFLIGFILFVVQENEEQKEIATVGFAIMLMGGGVSLVPDRVDRNDRNG